MATNDLPFVRKNWLNGCGQRLKELGLKKNLHYLPLLSNTAHPQPLNSNFLLLCQNDNLNRSILHSKPLSEQSLCTLHSI